MFPVGRLIASQSRLSVTQNTDPFVMLSLSKPAFDKAQADICVQEDNRLFLEILTSIASNYWNIHS